MFYELKSFEKFRLFSFNRQPLIMIVNIEDQNYMKILKYIIFVVTKNYIIPSQTIFYFYPIMNFFSFLNEYISNVCHMSTHHSLQSRHPYFQEPSLYDYKNNNTKMLQMHFINIEQINKNQHNIMQFKLIVFNNYTLQSYNYSFKYLCFFFR